MSRIFWSLTIIAAACSLPGCITGRLDAPEGYIETRYPGQYEQRFISSDHNVLAVRAMDNPKGGTLDFWTKAVRNELTSIIGYELKAESDIAAGRLVGRLFEFAASTDHGDYTYLVAVFVTDRQVSVVEAGGPADAMAADRDKLLHAIASLR